MERNDTRTHLHLGDQMRSEKNFFEMAHSDPVRKLSASTLLGQIEVWRLEYGRPLDEPRHPAIESDISWPLWLYGRLS